jgi:hypothetical protein
MQKDILQQSSDASIQTIMNTYVKEQKISEENATFISRFLEDKGAKKILDKSKLKKSLKKNVDGVTKALYGSYLKADFTDESSKWVAEGGLELKTENQLYLLREAKNLPEPEKNLARLMLMIMGKD